MATVKIYLSVSDTSSSDQLLLSGTGVAGYRIPMVTIGQLSAGWYPATYDPDYPSQDGTVRLSLPVRVVSTTSVDDLLSQFRAVFKKLEEARRARGPYGLGTHVTLWVELGGASSYVYYDVLGGSFQPREEGRLDLSLQPLAQGISLAGQLNLTCLPYPRGDAIAGSASTTRTNGALASPVYLAGILGDCRAVTQIQLKDIAGGNAINRVRMWVRSLQPMLSTDFTPIYDCTTGADGTQVADGASVGSFFQRITASATWQSIAQFASSTGAAQSGLFHIWARVRDSSAVLGSISSPAASVLTSAGSLSPGTYSAYLTTTDGTNESVPYALPTAIVPLTPTTIYDSAEGGDTSLWNGPVISGTGLNPQGDVTAQAAASLGATGSLGFRANAANGQGAFLYQATPGGGNTAVIRCLMRINTDSGTVGAATYTQIPLVFNGTTPVVSLFNIGAGWRVGTAVGVLDASILTLPEVDKFRFECEATWNGSTTYTVKIYVNDTLVRTTTALGGVTAPTNTGFGALTTTAGGAIALQVDFDDVQLAAAHIGANVAEIAYTWTAAPASMGGNGYNLYVALNNGVYRKIAVATLTTANYTLTSPTAGTIASPPTGAPAIGPGLFRLQYGLTGANPVTQVTPTAPLYSNSVWENLLIATVRLPNQAAQDRATELPWTVVIQGLSGGTNTPTLDVDCVWLEPADEVDNSVELTYGSGPTGATNGSRMIWQVDARYDGRVSCTLYLASSPTTVAGQATVNGRLKLGPGDNLIVAMVEVSDASHRYVSNVAATFQITANYSPVYSFLRSAA